MKQTVLYADGVGEIHFDGSFAVVSALDVDYPEIRPLSVDTMYRSRTQSVAIGAGKLTLEGYFLDREALTGRQRAPGKTAGTAPGKATMLKALLSAICAPGREFTLAVGGLSRKLYAEGLTFAPGAPFGEKAVKFTLRAFSDDPYFHGGEVCFAGVPRVSSPLFFPASLGFSTGVQRTTGEVTVFNDGDESCGFILEARFPAQSAEFIISSSREQGRAQLGELIRAGQTVVIDSRDGHKSVALADGTSLLSSLNERCAFFTAPPGTTKLTWRAFSEEPPSVSVRLTPGYLYV